MKEESQFKNVRRTADWYVSWFNTQEYLDLYKHRDEEDAKTALDLILENVKLSKGSNILDLACGNGRHSFLLAKRGFNVTGIDLSRFLISEAKKKLKGEYREYRDKLKFEIRDMRSFSYPRRFDLVLNLFTSFGYFENDSENEKVIRCAAGSLRKRGYLVIDYLNKGHLLKTLQPYSISRTKNKTIIQVRDLTNNYVVKSIYFVRKSDHKFDFEAYQERIKLYSLQDFKRMFRRGGLKMAKLFGNYEGSSFELSKSPRLILIGRHA